ncbi:DUF4148 domain-containing protein [Caballeronia ptereochthonis]|uniref:Purine nucleoside phosphorylase n=1 Tax=Caballeronia ptereochthonis TaxID=1777144 RepID=A0A157ZHA2_9BURK|nr:DUF4148 domain-containing protein [Caballeronia ptereochthonis]SAK44890.1 purine nucleoside phosphorylase [Caballeronia ptereochthonis]
MKTLIKTVLIACALSAPAFAFAQADNAPVTRAEVRADLVRVEQAGYRPAAVDPYYPADIQAAEAKIAAHGQTPEAASVGGVTTGMSQAGGPLASNDAQSIYAHH